MRRDFGFSEKLVDRGLPEERTLCRARSAHLARLCSCRVGAGGGEDPFAKVEDLIPSPISRVQTKDSPTSRHKPTVKKSCWRFTAMRHQQYVVYTVEVEADQSQQDASEVSELRQDVKHLQENDNANEKQFHEVGRDVARQLQHSNLQASGSNLDKVARQRCARRPRPEDKQVARGQSAQNRGSGRDEHPERQNERVAGIVAVKRQEQPGRASPSTARRTRLRTRTRFSQTRNTQRTQPSNSRTPESYCNHNVEREKTHVARDDSALSTGVPDAATSSQRQRRGSGNEHLGSTRPSSRPRDGDFREQRWTCLVRTARARERNAFMSASRSAH